MTRKEGAKVNLVSSKGRTMEENRSGGGGDGNIAEGWWWWWALASMAQLGWGMSSYRKGYAGDYRLMPVKAFAVASLFVGSAASASVAAIQASGIHKVEDLMGVGANIRTGLGISPRVPEEKADDL